jgi:cell division protein FtsX
LALGAWNNANKMLIFLNTDTPETKREELIQKIRTFDKIKSVYLVDRNTAGASFQSSLKEYANSLLTNDEMIDLIPETIEVDLIPELTLSERQAAFQQLADNLKGNESIEDLSYSASWLQKFEKIDRFLRSAGMSVFLITTLLVSYLISLMIRVYIDDSKSEIEVYNLLGATHWSIYKLYLKDLFQFLFFSLVTSVALSALFFSYAKKELSQSGLSKIVSDNLNFLNFKEAVILLFVLSASIFIHCFFTITSSVNKLNQINND